MRFRWSPHDEVSARSSRVDALDGGLLDAGVEPREHDQALPSPNSAALEPKCPRFGLRHLARRHEVHRQVARGSLQRERVGQHHLPSALELRGPDPCLDARRVRVGWRDVHHERRRRVARLVDNVPGAEGGAVFLHLAVDRRQVVIRGLHGPDVVARAAERLCRVRRPPDVDQHGRAVHEHDGVAHVVVVVALGVVRSPRGEVETVGRALAVARRHQLHVVARQPCVARQRGGRAAIGGHRLPAEHGHQRPANRPIAEIDIVLRDARCAHRAQTRIADGGPVAEHEAAVEADPGAAVADVDEPLVRDAGPVDVPPDVGDEGIGEVVDPPRGRRLQQFERLEQAGAGPSPVGRPFVAPAVGRVRPQERVEAAQDLVRERRPPSQVRFDEQRRGQHVGVDPRVPVVGPAGARGESHPPPVVAGLVRRDHPALDLAGQPRPDERRHLVEPVTEQVPGPGQRMRGLRGEQIDDGLGGVGQAARRLLRALVRRHRPRRLLGDGPRGVGDGVEEAALVLGAFGDHQRVEAVAPPEHGAFEAAAVAGARVIEEQRRGQGSDRLGQCLLGTRHDPGAEPRRDPLPSGAVRDGRNHVPRVTRQQHTLELGCRPVCGERRGFRNRARLGCGCRR